MKPQELQPQDIPVNVEPGALMKPQPLVHSYFICGPSNNPETWRPAPKDLQEKIEHFHSAIHQFWQPQLLGLTPSAMNGVTTGRPGSSSLYEAGVQVSTCTLPTLSSRMHKGFTKDLCWKNAEITR